MIEIRHLTKKYGENVAVNDLNITLEPGNIYGFLGPNGAGKSTTMNMITGYIGATSGEVIINGHDINKEPEQAKQCIGYLPELPPVYGDMKVLEYLKFVAELKKIDKHSQMADIKQVMDLTKLEPVKNRLIRNLSKGYRQRVGLAQALMGLPEIVILDEPTVGLDPKQIIEIREMIQSLREKHTVILSTHILQEVSAVCDHVFIIYKGKLVASDSMEHLEEEMSGAQRLQLTVRTTEEKAGGIGSIPGVKSSEIVSGIADDVKFSETDSEVVNDAESSEMVSGMADEMTVDIPEEDPGDWMEAEETDNMQDEKEIRMEVNVETGLDLRESVFRYCAENQIVLLEMTSLVKSLEDVFLELTGGKEEQ